MKLFKGLHIHPTLGRPLIFPNVFSTNILAAVNPLDYCWHRGKNSDSLEYWLFYWSGFFRVQLKSQCVFNEMALAFKKRAVVKVP